MQENKPFTIEITENENGQLAKDLESIIEKKPKKFKHWVKIGLNK
jgi:hypothetical protein